MQDVYTWRVVYQDGSITDEYDEQRADGRGFAEREDKPVRAVMLVPTDGILAHQAVLIPGNAEPVFFRRNALPINLGSDGPQQASIYCRCIGWKCVSDAKNEASKSEGSEIYLFVFNDGSTLLSEDVQAV